MGQHYLNIPLGVRTNSMDDTPSLSLVDNTIPQQPTGEGTPRRTSTLDRQASLTKHLSRASVQSQLTKRKYAKWQPERLGIAPDPGDSLSREPSQVRGGSISASSTGEGSGGRDTDTAEVSPSRIQSIVTTDTGLNGAELNTRGDGKPRSEMDILYENQRGSFMFGVPRYSHSSLLNFDPAAWMTQDRRASAVNITNAQLPDPSWEWAWKAWYVDMSGDTDEQGWQYSFSFSSSSWHGTQPWFHSFVRRRRWVRLRTKVPDRRLRGRSDFEKAHMLNGDYFTIHTPRAGSREQSIAGLSRVESGFLNRASMTVDEEPHIDEIGDIPSLLHALKLASIDRERIDALKKFVEEGGDELYYLTDKVSQMNCTLHERLANPSRYRTSCQPSYSKHHVGSSSHIFVASLASFRRHPRTPIKMPIQFSARRITLLAQQKPASDISLGQMSLKMTTESQQRNYWI